MNNIHKTET